MSSVEILVPLRIETRFTPPDAPGGSWQLRLRVYPDTFSMAAAPAPPSRDELDLLDLVLAAPFRDPPVSINAAFGPFADKVGPARAVWLLTTVRRIEVNGVPLSDRTGAQIHDPGALPTTRKPMGLPPSLGVFLLPAGGGDAVRIATLELDRNAITADLDLSAFLDTGPLRDAKLPETWWTSYARAVTLGLATHIDLGPETPDLEGLIVCGLGDTDPSNLVAAHIASGELAVLAAGTPTNTVDGEPTTDLGRDPEAWRSLVGADPAEQPAARAIMKALGAKVEMPTSLPGGEIDPVGHGPALVAALWPVLWGRFLRDLEGAEAAAGIAQWASVHLAPEGPYPAIRIGEQPYGLLPIASLERYVSDTGIDARLRDWTLNWSRAAAQEAENAGTALDAPTERLVELLGETAPTRAWGLRPLAALPVVRALRIAAGLPDVTVSEWEQATARALADYPMPLAPLGPFGELFPLPPKYETDDPNILKEMLNSGVRVLKEWRHPLGLLGHLMLEAALMLRARAGTGVLALAAGSSVEADPLIPLDLAPNALIDRILAGSDTGVATLRASGDPAADLLAKAFGRGMDHLFQLLDRYWQDPAGVFSALLATLDTASHRVDPWIIGLADTRLRSLSDAGAPFRLGAYGWVDRPRPFTGNPGSPPPPGPTPAGLLHAPSYAQALTSALLRDAAVRYPGEDRWQIAIDSAKTRTAMRLAERVRLGVHPYEALGLEVERLVGDWNQVRLLRSSFPMRPTHGGRRCCDGVRVLAAVLRGAEPLPAGLAADIATRIVPLDQAMDTYGDLLVADGVYALVSGQGGLGNAAMEAAAGLGAPPELRAIRTPRSATSVRVSTWALLLPGTPAESLASRADPAFAALVEAEIGPPANWLWHVGATSISLADTGLTGADVLDLAPDKLANLLRAVSGPDTPPQAPVVSQGGEAKRFAANRLAELLGGGDADPIVPDPTSGRDDAHAATNPLRDAMLADLGARFQDLRARAATLLVAIDAADPPPDLPAQLLAWRLADDEAPTAARTRLAERLAAAEKVGSGTTPLRLAIRALVGQPRLPVLSRVDRSLLPDLAPIPTDPDGHPETDAKWLEIAAAARPRLAFLEARQLDPTRVPWPAALATGDGSGDPWTIAGPVILAYGPGTPDAPGLVAIAGLDAFSESIPSRAHVTSAAFGFNGPKARPPQAVLIGVPPNPGSRMSNADLVETVLEARRLARARALGPGTSGAARIATPTMLASAAGGFLDHWELP